MNMQIGTSTHDTVWCTDSTFRQMALTYANEVEAVPCLQVGFGLQGGLGRCAMWSCNGEKLVSSGCRV